ncbi:MAG: TIGR02453 family protein [Pseudomonadota bacterium]|nr:TIGR02453 family protein [Pseudomonadota bacterium]
MPFAGFGPQALPFLKALAFHQTKEWFEANKATFEADLKGPMGDLVEDLSAAFAKAKIPLKGERKTAVFRIHRDVRFAKDKSPYKTNHGAVLTRTGSKNEPGLFYVHVAPEGCFTAAGFYAPEPETLARLRGAMARKPKAWKAMLGKLAQSGLAPDGEFAMTRNPRGFEGVEDAEITQALRLKSIIVRRPLAAERLGERGLIDDLAGFGREALPLLQWGWDAISDSRSA